MFECHAKDSPSHPIVDSEYRTLQSNARKDATADSFRPPNLLRLDDVVTARTSFSFPMRDADRGDGATKAPAHPRPTSSVERIAAERMMVWFDVVTFWNTGGMKDSRKRSESNES